MLQNDIDEIKDYFRSLETYNDALIVRVQFPPKWKVFPSDDGTKKLLCQTTTHMNTFITVTETMFH